MNRNNRIITGFIILLVFYSVGGTLALTEYISYERWVLHNLASNGINIVDGFVDNPDVKIGMSNYEDFIEYVKNNTNTVVFSGTYVWTLSENRDVWYFFVLLSMWTIPLIIAVGLTPAFLVYFWTLDRGKKKDGNV